MSKKETHCSACGAPFIWDMLTDERHDRDLCLGRQLQSAKSEIKKLQVSVKNWQESWQDVREILGKLWWHHEAIYSDAKRAYYQANLKQLDKKE